jgi:hypothetical protein
VTFGDGNQHIRAASRRITNEAKSSNYFRTIKSYDTKSLLQEFPGYEKELSVLQNKYKKGLGLFFWKIILIRESLQLLPEDSILLYLDSGCHIRLHTSRQLTKMQEYLRVLEYQPVMAFQIRDFQFGDNTDFSEQHWSLRTLMEELDLNLDNRLSNQIESGVIFLRNNPTGRAFVDEWLRLARKNEYEFLMDCEILINDKTVGFNRHDQSIFSCLYKSMQFVPYPNENYFDGEWDTKGINYPIWTRRNRTGISLVFSIRDTPEKIILVIEKILQKILSKVRIIFKSIK